MSITPYQPGQHVTGLRLAFPVMYQESVSGGPTSGGTELVLATLVVPDQGVPTIQIPSAHWNGNPDSDGANDRWQFLIRDTDVSGTIRGRCMAQTSAMSAVVRIPFSIPAADMRSVPSGAATYCVTIVRAVTAGTGGTINAQPGNPGQLSVLVLPDPSAM